MHLFDDFRGIAVGNHDPVVRPTLQESLRLQHTERFADRSRADAKSLGETTNRIIERYGFPVPETIPSHGRPYPTNPPIPAVTPPPSPSASPAPAASGDIGNVPAPSAATP